MYQDDSNGETSFEIIDKKTDELNLTDRPPQNAPPVATTLGGNLLSNVGPPSSLPSFIATIPVQANPVNAPPTVTPISNVPLQPVVESQQLSQTSQAATLPPPLMYAVSGDQRNFYQPPEFSAAIPPNKGVVTMPTTQQPAVAVPTEGGGLMGWMKEAMSGGGILSKVAEKAKSSVDSMITTLDPQMKEYIYSGGDIDVLVASGQQEKVSAIREAFQIVFGKATVGSIPAQATNIAAQPVGFASALKSAEERIDTLIKTQNFKDLPVVAVENFLLDVGDDKWFDLGLLLLEDRKRGIKLQTFTQMTPVPSEVVALAHDDTPVDYVHKDTGFSIPIGGLMARNLQVDPKDWHRVLTGVSRREMILLAARSLANLYKNSIC